MYTISCFWAGYLIFFFERGSEESVLEKVGELKDRLKAKAITQVSCGQVIVLTELCVDVVQDGKLVAMHNLKV